MIGQVIVLLASKPLVTSFAQPQDINGGTSLGEVLLGIALVVIFLSFFFFVMRWQIRLFNDLRESLRRIADAIEAIAQRR